MDAINKCDTSVVPGEYAELLLKFLPTKEEVSISYEVTNPVKPYLFFKIMKGFYHFPDIFVDS